MWQYPLRFTCYHFKNLNRLEFGFTSGLYSRNLSKSTLRSLPNVSGTLQKNVNSPTSYETNTTDAPSNFDLNDDFSILVSRNQRHLIYPTKSTILKTFERRLKCSASKAEEILKEIPTLQKQSLSNMMQIIKYLTDHDVKLNSIVDNAWLLAHTPKHLKIKFQIIQLMRPMNINDFVPLLKITAPRLNQILKITKTERSLVSGGHRVYFLSNKLKVEPYLVSTYLATRFFIFNVSFENLSGILNLMLKFNVDSHSILRDLWAFRYSPEAVESRLVRAKAGQKDKLMPWMVRCTEPVLAKSIQNTLDEKALLGDDTIVDYISKRLQLDRETTEFVLQKHPSVFNVRVTKVKKIIDYLLDEAGFTGQDIAQNPRILCHSLQTTKDRIEQLKMYGCKPSSLVIVCKSKNEYGKFLNSWIDVRNQLKEKNIINASDTVNQ